VSGELSQPARRVLDVLAGSQPMTRTELAAVAGIWKSNIGRYIVELRDKGLIRGERGTGKSILFSPTQKPDIDILFDVFVRRAKP
jgi:chromosome segregation and condensation protein ScpB